MTGCLRIRMCSRFIRVVACVTTYFIPFYYHIFYSMFMLLFKTPVFSLWTNELFPLVCTVNNAAMNICICIMFVGMYLFVFSWVVPSSRTAGSYGDCVTSSGADKLLYRVTAPFCGLISRIWGFQYLHTLAFIIVCFFIIAILAHVSWFLYVRVPVTC